MTFLKNSFILLFSLIVFSAHSQLNINSDSVLRGRYPDSLSTDKKNWIKPSGLILTTNMTVWGFDRYIINAPYARIDYNTIKSNFRTGFEWDNDNFITNLFTHPVNGLLYFDAVRANGFNFWQSILFTAGGSLMWELAMENQAPSINDLISTTIGGVCLGEISFRITDRFIDNRTTGFERFKREALVFLISPTREINRLISGETFKHSAAGGNSISPVPMTFYLSLGSHSITDNFVKNNKISTMPCYDLGIYYGNPYDPENEKPYDFFWCRAGGNFSSLQPALDRVNALGMIFIKNVPLNKPTNQLAVGIFQHYNYYQLFSELNNGSISTYQISETAGLGPGIFYKSRLRSSIGFSGSFHLSAILLGGSQTDHYRFDQRDYNMGSGYSAKLSFELLLGNKVRLFMNSENYRIYSWTGNNPSYPEKFNSNVTGDKGNHSNCVVNLNLSYVINNHVLVEAGTSYYYLKSIYTYYPATVYSDSEVKFSIGYIF